MRIVVDDEDTPATQIGLEYTRPGDRRALTEPRGKSKSAPLADLTLNRDVAAHHLGELLGDRQAKAGTAIIAGGRGVGLLEGLEQALYLHLAAANAVNTVSKLDELAV